jgi:CheY-like chemotaxis protein
MTLYSYRQKLSVLFVDDDHEVLEAFGGYLETSGVQVTKAANARDAIVAAARLLPNVIVLDVAMPGLDGYAVIHALQARAETSQIPVVLFTGTTSPRIRREPQVRACVQKPCTPNELLGVVRMFGGRA